VTQARVRILYNPASGRDNGARAIVPIRAAFARCGFTDVRGTTHAGDEARLVATAIADGVETIVVVGGDGTWSNCAVPLAKAGSPARMALLAAGTGNDFAKNLGLDPRDPRALAERLADGGVRERRVDLGRVDDTWFLNVAGFGFDVAVLRASMKYRRLRGPAVYVATALQEIFGYPGLPIAVDGGAPRPHLLAVFSNGKHFGGAFHIAPGARVDDGALDAILIADVPKLARLPLLARAIVGKHLASRHVTHRRTASMRLSFAEAPWFEVDGELRRAAGPTVEVAIVPAALRVVDA
jgi:diacylglycerol kinase (ATP)